MTVSGEASFPIIDPHQHFWALGQDKNPWLCHPPWVGHRYGDYAAVRRDYLPDDYLRDADGFDVVKTVYVDAEWEPDDPAGEVRWARSVHAERGYPHAMVAQAWLDRDEAAEVLAEHAETGFVRSIRHKPTTAPARHQPAPFPRGSMSEDRWRRGYAELERNGLHFDLQVVYWHLAEAAELARDFPATQIILNHTGLPADRSQAGLAAWREAMTGLAMEPNVVVKISGLGVPGVAWTVAANRDVVLDTVRIFGIDRCMFASNFPVDGLCGSYHAIMGGFMEIVADLNEADQRKLFHDNAERVYRL